MARTPLAAALLITAWEELRLEPYQDAAGIWTWGWGHAQKKGEARPPTAITREEAVRIFLSDLEAAEHGVLAALDGAQVTDTQLGALVSLVFNIGAGAFRGSTMLALIKAGRLSEVSEQFERWIYAKGKRLRGLVERRASERRLWES